MLMVSGRRARLTGLALALLHVHDKVVFICSTAFGICCTVLRALLRGC
jgi:hypothetical protein